MKTPLWLRSISALTVFYALAYMLFEFSAGFRYFVRSRVGTFTEYLTSEFEGFRRLLINCDFLVIVAIISPPLLAAMYVFKCLERRKLQFSMRGILLAFLCVAMFMTFRHRPSLDLYNNEMLVTILGLGYSVLLLTMTWTIYLGLRDLEIKKEEDECPEDDR